MLTIIPGTTIRFTIRPLDAAAGYAPLQPDTPPVAGGISVRKNGVTLVQGGGSPDYSVAIGAWNNGYLVTITLTAAAVAGDHFAIQATYSHLAVTYYWHEIGTCEHTAGAGGGGGGDATLANQVAILGLLSPPPTFVVGTYLNARKLFVTAGDQYNDLGWPKFRWDIDHSLHDLTGATGAFAIRDSSDTVINVTSAVAIESPGVAGQKVALTLSGILPANAGEHDFDIEITKTSGGIITPIFGKITIRRDQKRSS